MKQLFSLTLTLVALLFATSTGLQAQGVTGSLMNGVVTDQGGDPLQGVSVTAVHLPSGTRYSTVTRGDGRFVIPGMRVGGPYEVTTDLIGYAEQRRSDINLNLGVAEDLAFRLTTRAMDIEGITVTGAARGGLIGSDRTGAATTVRRETIEALPTIDRRIGSIVRLTPQADGFNFAGQDRRLNNITVDGSYFNNSFGLGGQPGDRTGVAPISLDAIEEVQVNVAPFDVRQGNFVGAGVNSVTRSGTNEWRGSLYHIFRNDGLVGTQAGDNEVDPGSFDFGQWGAWISGPLVEDKLFFFSSFETDTETGPGTTFLANTGQTPGGNITRVSATDLDQLSSFLSSNLDYETGPYQGYDHETPSLRFLGKLDFNLNDKNKFSVRYSHLDSDTDALMSNSGSLGFGGRRTRTDALNFQNSNYQILENIRSVVGEWNAIVGGNMANNLIVGYTSHDESRASRGTRFPMVDILSEGSTYTSFGFEPFTPNNELRYSSIQFQNNFSLFLNNHSLVFGATAERYVSENVFFPGSQSAYVYNSLEDFYTDANDYLANPNRTTSPVELRRFQVRWSNIPGQDKPVQPLEVFYAGLYAQDEWRVNADLRLTLGARVDVPFFGDTGFRNAEVEGFTFRDENGQPVRYATDKLPDPNLLFSPRLGLNWNVFGDQTTQLRGGTGIFTGRPAYVWISNQIGNNGVLTGFERLDGTDTRPFHPDPDHYKPSNVTGAPAERYELSLTDPSFRFPQVWRTNIAVDQQLPLGLVTTAEFLYNRDVNGIYYINANLADPDATFTGVDNRPRWTGSNRINADIDNAIVLKNQNVGSSYVASLTVERPFSNGLYYKAAYSYGESKNTVNPGSIAFGSWNNNPHAGNPNNPGVGLSSATMGHRVFGAVTLAKRWLPVGNTSVSIFAQNATGGVGSYRFSGDLNGDGGFNNDLVYVHRDVSEMNFQEYTSREVTFTAAQQAAAWDAFIEQDPYLSGRRGQYAEPNGARLPRFTTMDLSVSQEIGSTFGGARNSVELRVDVLNFLNLLNSDWGVAQRFVNTQPLIARGADGAGRAQYRLRSIGGQLMSEAFEPTAGLGDVYRMQFSVRYRFN